MAQVRDITRTLGRDALVWPGDPPYEREELEIGEPNAPCLIARIALSSHTGTHMDAPRHVFPDGKTLDRYEPDRFALDAVVASMPGRTWVARTDVADIAFAPGEAVLFRTDNELLDRHAVAPRFTTVAPDAAALLVERGASLVGIDYLSVDPPEAADLPTHRVLLEGGALILEDVDLRDVPAGRYRLICAPLRLEGSEGAPCRALLFDYESPEAEASL